MKIEMIELRQLLETAATLGAKQTLVSVGLDKTEISKAEAYRRYNRRSVDEWIKTKLITPSIRGSKVRLKVVELDVLSQSEQLSSLLESTN